MGTSSEVEKTTIEYKVEWVDEQGIGHWTEFQTEELALKYIERISDICMMLDLYKRKVTQWIRQ